MATSVPPSMTFEMLSRLPANSFVAMWKEIRPDQAPQNNVYPVGQRNRIRFVLRGAPNEFALNTNMFLCGSVYGKVRKSDLDNTPLTAAQQGDLITEPPLCIHSAYHLFQSSRESFNAGALPYLDNQDINQSFVINALRYTSARRNRRAIGADFGTTLDDLNSSFFGCNQALKAHSTSSLLVGQDDAASIRYLINTDGGQVAFSAGKAKSFQIPLGLYSNFVNSPSVIPLGLLSSYAVNGWQIELETTEQVGNSGKAYDFSGNVAGQPATAEVTMKDLRIYVPVIRVLDPAVMEAVLSLYEKREQVAVGATAFPLSLRINSMAYRTAQFPIISGQSDYFFRIAGTDRSVRAMAWYITKRSNLEVGFAAPTTATQPCLRVTRLETRIGTEHVHEVVEDVDTTSDNVSNFVAVNGRKSAALFSPLPYYQEGSKFDGMQEDDLDPYNNCLQSYSLTNSSSIQVQRNALCYGYVSLENLDRREGDYSGGFQASGKDLTNVGAIEVNMRINQVAPPVVNASSQLSDLDKFTLNAPSAADYTIQFVYCYDSIFEVSPQGIMDVTNAVL